MLVDKIRIATRVHSLGCGNPRRGLIIERSARFRSRRRCRPLLSRSVSIRIVICCCHASWTCLEIYCVSIIPAPGFIVHRLVVIVRHRDTISALSAVCLIACGCLERRVSQSFAQINPFARYFQHRIWLFGKNSVQFRGSSFVVDFTDQIHPFASQIQLEDGIKIIYTMLFCRNFVWILFVIARAPMWVSTKWFFVLSNKAHFIIST